MHWISNNENYDHAKTCKNKVIIALRLRVKVDRDRCYNTDKDEGNEGGFENLSDWVEKVRRFMHLLTYLLLAWLPLP